MMRRVPKSFLKTPDLVIGNLYPLLFQKFGHLLRISKVVFPG
jgi:hypothetical protein